MKPQGLLSLISITTLFAAGVAIHATAQTSGTPGTNPTSSPSAGASGSPGSSPSSSPSAGAGGGSVLGAVWDAYALNYINHVNNIEIQDAGSAVGKASGQALTLAQAMSTDHSGNEQQLTQLAATKNVNLYSFAPTEFEQASDNLLTQMSGNVYDQAFLQIEAADHQDGITKLQSLEGKVDDPEIRSFIAQTITVMQKHLSLAQGSGGAQPSNSPSAQPSPSQSPGSAGGASGSGSSGSSTGY